MAEEQEYKCIHCGQKFKSYKAICCHMRWCGKRSLKRTFTVNGYLFTVMLNPLKRVVKALRDCEKDLATKKNTPERAFIGALMAFKAAGYVNEFKVEQVGSDQK